MKTRVLGIVMVLVLLAGTVVTYADDADVSALPGSGWWEASLIQNASTTDTASVVFTPIAGLGVSGVTADPYSTTIAPGASVNLMPGSFGVLTMDDGFKGSAIVSSNQPIVAIGSIGNNPVGNIGVSGGRAAAQYPGISQDDVGTKISYPVVKNDYINKTTTFYVQTVQAGTVYVTYLMNNGANTYTAQATTTTDGQMATFSPGDAGIPADCAAGNFACLGAATVTSTVPLAGIYVEHNDVDSPAQILLSTRGFTDNDASTTVVVPVIKSLWRGRTTGVQIQNVGTAASTITLTLAYQAGSATGAGGQSVVFPSVPSGASVTHFPGNHTSQDTLMGPFGGGPTDEFVGSATITSDQPMVAIVNENDFAASTATKQTVFAAFPQAAGTDTILFPLAKEAFNGNNTGIQIQNVGANNVTLTADYVLQSSSFTVSRDAVSNTITVAPGAAFTFYGVTQFWNGSHDASTGDFGAVTVRATGTGTPMIVGIAQEAEFPVGGLGFLDTKNYEGFNQ